MARIFVTGAAGWLGLNLIEALAGAHNADSGLESEALTLLLHSSDSEREVRTKMPHARIVRGDLTYPGSLKDLFADGRDGILFHMAGIIHPSRVREFFEINRDGTRHLLEAAKEAGVRRAVVVSSNSPCGCNPHPDHRFDEDSSYRPYMNYGKSKMEMEQLVQEFYERGDMETVIVRAPWFYGPHQPPRQKLFFEMIRDGKMPLVGDGQNLRSMAYTGNLAQGLLLAATKAKAAGQTYWIADERPYSMNEIIETIERLLESEFQQSCAHRRIKLPNVVSDIAYLADLCMQSLGLYHQKIHVLSEMNKSIACSIDKAKRELNYLPVVSLEEGMRRSLAEVFSTTSNKKKNFEYAGRGTC